MLIFGRSRVLNGHLIQRNARNQFILFIAGNDKEGDVKNASREFKNFRGKTNNYCSIIMCRAFTRFSRESSFDGLFVTFFSSTNINMSNKSRLIRGRIYFIFEILSCIVMHHFAWSYIMTNVCLIFHNFLRFCWMKDNSALFWIIMHYFL